MLEPTPLLAPLPPASSSAGSRSDAETKSTRSPLAAAASRESVASSAATTKVCLVRNPHEETAMHTWNCPACGKRGIPEESECEICVPAGSIPSAAAIAMAPVGEEESEEVQKGRRALARAQAKAKTKPGNTKKKGKNIPGGTSGQHGGDTAIHAASSSGQIEVVHMLLESGADVNVTSNSDGASPLMRACEGGCVTGGSENSTAERFIAVAEALMTAGCDMAHQDMSGRTALHIAFKHRQTDMVRMGGAHPVWCVVCGVLCGVLCCAVC